MPATQPVSYIVHSHSDRFEDILHLFFLLINSVPYAFMKINID